MILIGTENGIYSWDERTGLLSDNELAGSNIVQLSSSRNLAFALDITGQVFSKQAGVDWREVSTNSVAEVTRSLFAHPGTGTLYLGTEPPRLYRLTETGWILVADLMALDGSGDWYTPYGAPPAVRSFSSSDGDTFYLSIHVGGVLKTIDAGRSWAPINVGLDLDVHQITTMRQQPSIICAATATGFAFSENQGASWITLNEGLENLYTRALAVHPDHPEVILISGSRFMPDDWEEKGKWFSLFRSIDKGKNWKKVTSGFPEYLDSEIDTQHIDFSQEFPNSVLCGARSGSLYASKDGGASWSIVSNGLPPINALAFCRSKIDEC